MRATVGGKAALVLGALARQVWPAAVPPSVPGPAGPYPAAVRPDAPPNALAAVVAGQPIPDGAVVQYIALPAYAQQALDDLAGRVDDLLRRALRAVVWRGGVRSRRAPISGWPTPELSADGERWTRVAIARVGSIEFANGATPVDVSPAFVADVARAVGGTGDGEPIGHELLHEARHQAAVAPRGALVMAVAAAEAGYKQAVAALVPAAAWLMREIPSPPLVKLLQQHLPQMPARAAFADRPSCPATRSRTRARVGSTGLDCTPRSTRSRTCSGSWITTRAGPGRRTTSRPRRAPPSTCRPSSGRGRRSSCGRRRPPN